MPALILTVKAVLRAAFRIKSVSENFCSMEKGRVEVQALPFYTIGKTRPPSLLGGLF